MTKVHESFSAFLDGEASELDIQRMLNAMDEDPSVVNKWHQLSSAKAVLNNEEVSRAGLQLAADPDEHPAAVSLLNWMPKASVAALLAVAITSGYWVLQAPSLSNEVPQISVNNIETSNTVTAATQYQAQQRLQYFLKQHIEQASFSTGHGVIPSNLTWTEVSETYE